MQATTTSVENMRIQDDVEDESSDDDDEDGLVMRGLKRAEESWLA